MKEKRSLGTLEYCFHTVRQLVYVTRVTEGSTSITNLKEWGKGEDLSGFPVRALSHLC